METEFKAPWGALLIVITIIATAIIIGVPLFVYFTTVSTTLWQMGIKGFIFIVLPLILILCLLFTIRGYSLSNKTLYIQRLLWKTKIDLSGLTEVKHDPDEIKGSIRAFGNGGLFSFSGFYWNRRLGLYRIYATKFKNSVIMRLPKRPIVVTPGNPRAFVDAVKKELSL